MNLQLLNHAEVYYQLAGFSKLPVPWWVTPKVSAITKPRERNDFLIKEKALVGSAEQSFLQLAFENKMPKGRFLATTPCFRDEPKIDELHQYYFLKTELIDTENANRESLLQIIEISRVFFEKFVRVEVVETGENSYDIQEIKNGIELGSYGIRETSFGKRKFAWIFATGCAEPRLSLAVEANKRMGYHHDLSIPKSELGSITKIFEELHELQDAALNKQKLLILCELADLIGAIKGYLAKGQPEIKLRDLNDMSRLTERAFKVGSR